VDTSLVARRRNSYPYWRRCDSLATFLGERAFGAAVIIVKV
jgi:hypothetical protein